MPKSNMARERKFTTVGLAAIAQALGDTRNYIDGLQITFGSGRRTPTAADGSIQTPLSPPKTLNVVSGLSDGNRLQLQVRDNDNAASYTFNEACVHAADNTIYGRIAETDTSLNLGSKAAGNIQTYNCLLYTSPSPRDRQKSRMPSSA